MLKVQHNIMDVMTHEVIYHALKIGFEIRTDMCTKLI